MYERQKGMDNVSIAPALLSLIYLLSIAAKTLPIVQGAHQCYAPAFLRFSPWVRLDRCAYLRSKQAIPAIIDHPYGYGKGTSQIQSSERRRCARQAKLAQWENEPTRQRKV